MRACVRACLHAFWRQTDHRGGGAESGLRCVRCGDHGRVKVACRKWSVSVSICGDRNLVVSGVWSRTFFFVLLFSLFLFLFFVAYAMRELKNYCKKRLEKGSTIKVWYWRKKNHGGGGGHRDVCGAMGVRWREGEGASVFVVVGRGPDVAQRAKRLIFFFLRLGCFQKKKRHKLLMVGEWSSLHRHEF